MSELSPVEAVKLAARNNSLDTSSDTKQLELYLHSWWSRTYNRPLKDPLLQQYTIYELLYEYYDKIERERAAEIIAEQENDKIEEEKEQETLDWIEEEERREAEEREKAQQQEQHEDVTTHEDEQWMIEQLKKERGDDFGEDIDIDFSE